MTRALAIIVTLIFLVIASYVFISMRPVALPKALDPVANWFDERRGEAAKTAPSIGAGNANPGTADTTTAETVAGRSSVAEVTIAKGGAVSVKADATAKAAAETAATEIEKPKPVVADVSKAVTVQATSPNPVSQEKQATKKQSSTNPVTRATAATRPAGDGNQQIEAPTAPMAASSGVTTNGAVTVAAKATGAAAETATSANSAAGTAGTKATQVTKAASAALSKVAGSTPSGTDQQPASVPPLPAVSATELSRADTALAAGANSAPRVLGQTEEDLRNAPAGTAIDGKAVQGSAQTTVTRDAASSATDALASRAARAALRARASASAATAATPAASAPTQAIAGATSSGQARATNGAKTPTAVSAPAAPIGPVAMAKPAVSAAPAVAADPALLSPTVSTPPPRTIEAVQQQRTILNFLDGKVVEFEVGRDRLTAAGIRVLDRLVPIINAHEDTVITVQGHTDDIGDDRSNLELSAARAIVARRYLISRGIAPERLRAQGLGERNPRATNLTEAGRIRNRRIDFAVSDIRDSR